MNFKLKILFLLLLVHSVSISQDTFNKKMINDTCLKFAQLITKGSMVQNNAVGIAGMKPKQFFYYDSLIMFSNESELIELTNHPDPKVRCYAFLGLNQIGSKKIIEVIRKNENDTAKIMCQSGCIVYSRSVISYLLYHTKLELISRLNAEDKKYFFDLKERTTKF